MKIRALVPMLACLALALPASYAGETTNDVPPGAWFFCRSNFPVGQTFYFSTTQSAAGATTRGQLQNPFMEHLRTKYRYPHDASVSCVYATGGDMRAVTESSRQQTLDNLHAANYEVVVTDWQYVN